MSYKMQKRNSPKQHNFAEVPAADIQRSSFNRSHTHKTCMDAGYLYPIYVDECLPGDTFKMNTSVFARMATPLFPVLDNAVMSVHFFAVPKRLLWDNFEKFMGAQENPGDSTSFNIPEVQMPASGVGVNSFEDYIGIPLGYEGNVNSWWHRAYPKIWNEWYRDENLQDSETVPLDDGPDPAVTSRLLKRGKRHDYFTSCLPFAQKGPAVDLPLGTTAPVVGDGNIPLLDINGTDEGLAKTFVVNSQYAFTTSNSTTADASPLFSTTQTGLQADLSNATAATINSLRMAFQLQRMYERDARGGTRYIEAIKAHFNVTSPDARLQRSEFLGGGKINLSINPVPNTAGPDFFAGEGRVGDLSGVGTIAGSGMGFNKSFTEDMIVMGIACITCDLTYQQGLNRMFSRRTRFDNYFPALSHLGEQEVLNKEIYADNSAADDETFGYQERYAEYRYYPSRISSIMRSTAANSLDAWHYSQEFASLPTLSADFIEENPPISRVIAVQSEPEFIVDMYFNLICDRPMPVYSVPGLIDHF